MPRESGWKQGLPAARIKPALKGFHADCMAGGQYRLSRTDGDIATILGSIGANVENSIYTEPQLWGTKSETLE
ncbi:MAG: hypothetical protein FWG10_14285 [Eubacteriaceae bacterium]|nr:hypothetical protein [Eubacteriaceae bacterium]